MPRGAKKGERRGGRAKGTPNKRTIEQRIYATQQALHSNYFPKTGNAPLLGKQVIERQMHIAAEWAARYEPNANSTKADIAEFEKWARLAVDWASRLAPYQSPTFRAIMISPPDEKPSEGVTVVRTLKEVREHMIIRGVPPEQLGQVLSGPPKLIEHMERERDEAQNEKPAA